jgi:hypothetical protein
MNLKWDFIQSRISALLRTSFDALSVLRLSFETAGSRFYVSVTSGHPAPLNLFTQHSIVLHSSLRKEPKNDDSRMMNAEVSFTPFTPLERSGSSFITQHSIILHSSFRKRTEEWRVANEEC